MDHLLKMILNLILKKGQVFKNFEKTQFSQKPRIRFLIRLQIWNSVGGKLRLAGTSFAILAQSKNGPVLGISSSLI